MKSPLSHLFDLGYMDSLSRADTRLHRADPRAKALTVGAFLIAVVSFPPHAVSGLVPLVVFPLVWMRQGRVPADYLLHKLLLAAPFVLLVAGLNPWLDRAPIALGLGGTLAAGWFSFGSILLRFTLTVSAALLLLASTGIYSLCAALEALGLPRLFAMQILFLYRYLFVLMEEAARLARAALLRAPGARHIPWRAYRPMLGHWLLRTIDRAQRIHLAMCARGFQGHFPGSTPLRWTRADTAMAAGWASFFLLARCVPLARWSGRALLELFA